MKANAAITFVALVGGAVAIAYVYQKWARERTITAARAVIDKGFADKAAGRQSVERAVTEAQVATIVPMSGFRMVGGGSRG